jgi:hypothetical protein
MKLKINNNTLLLIIYLSLFLLLFYIHAGVQGIENLDFIKCRNKGLQHKIKYYKTIPISININLKK